MSRVPPAKDWRKLAQAARQEKDPKKFVYLLHKLYCAVNARKPKRKRRSSPLSARTQREATTV